MLPARRISKSKDATPVVSDNEDTPEATQATQADTTSAVAGSKKGKLRKTPPEQPDEGSAKKRRKRSSSRTPEPSGSGPASAEQNGQVSPEGLNKRVISLANAGQTPFPPPPLKCHDTYSPCTYNSS